MKVAANGLEFEVERLGKGEPVMLIMGVGAQMILWPRPLLEALHSQGFETICFDNRDVGQSSWLNEAPVPDLPKMMLRGLAGLRISAPYTLWDMADDVADLMTNLGIDKAHIVGASMGGMIAQLVAIRHPERVRSLTSIMSTTGERRHLFATKFGALRALAGGKPPTNREEGGERLFQTFAAISGPRYPAEETYLRELGARAFDRGSNPAGFARQFAGILASGARDKYLRSVRAPTLVMHGTDDPLVPISAGRATAACVQGSWMLEFQGMGHSLPPPLWSTMASAIGHNARRTI